MAELRIYSIPTHLFRYRPLGSKARRELEAIEQGYIYCPTFSSMNDPMEGSHRLSLRMLSNRDAHREVRQAQARLGVASFSEVFDHEPMWAHYADRFTGMCIQYNTRRLLRGLPDNVDIARMMYSEKEPTILEERQTPDDRAKMTLSSKTVRWASEREWRIFRPEVGKATYSAEDTVTRVYLGSRVSEEDEQSVRQVCKPLGISVAFMKINSYAMSFSSVRQTLTRP